MNSIQITGKVTKIIDPDPGKFNAIKIVVEEAGAKYPNPVVLELKKDEPCSAKEGDSVDAEFWLNGREFNGRYFLNAKVANLNVLDSEIEPVQEVPF